MPSNELTVTVFARGRLITGKVFTSGERLLELLTVGSSEFIRLHDATVRTIDGTVALPLPTAAIRKSHIGLAIPVSESREAVDNLFFTYRKKSRYDVVAMTDGYLVQGTIHLQAFADELKFMSRDLASFVPLTNVRVHNGYGGSAPLEEPIVIVNTQYLTLLHIGEPATADNVGAGALAASRG